MAIGIGYSTLRKNMDQYRATIKKGRDLSDSGMMEILESALLKKVQGYSYEETVVERRGTLDDRGKFTGTSQAVQKKITKHVPPSDTMIIFTIVNKSKGIYQSVNNRVIAPDNDRGEILAAIQDMKKNAVKPKAI